MTKCDFCNKSILKNGHLECTQQNSIRLMDVLGVCNDAIDKLMQTCKTQNEQEEK